MKTTTIRTITKRAMMLITLVLFLTLLSNINTHYTRDAWVDNVEGNVVTFVDSCGYTWEATDVDNIVEGQTVVLKMHNHHTDNVVSDDVIVSIKPVAITLQ